MHIRLILTTVDKKSPKTRKKLLLKMRSMSINKIYVHLLLYILLPFI